MVVCQRHFSSDSENSRGAANSKHHPSVSAEARPPVPAPLQFASFLLGPKLSPQETRIGKHACGACRP
ncbi:hypothetical protein AMECASPLE_017022 [Ameca splendens]|uniref:THAP-type domain-containing protein n=2 Tax=Goodeidae TaxID=28758 RepID=A0ABU7F3E0_9TELE|nr:hypothetical protein [Characodon lateralis]